MTLQAPLFDLGFTGAPGRMASQASRPRSPGRDLILIAGGLFLLWKATKEIHHNIDPEPESGELLDQDKGIGEIAFTAAIAQIIALDLVFSIDSILTAVGHDRRGPDHGRGGGHHRQPSCWSPPIRWPSSSRRTRRW